MQLPTAKLNLAVTTCDSDGVATTTTVPMADAEGQSTSTESALTTMTYIKIGRLNSAVHIALLEGDKTLDRREIQCQAFRRQLACRLFAGDQRGRCRNLAKLRWDFAKRCPIGIRRRGMSPDSVVEVDSAGGLPTEWFGYEGVDVLVLTTADLEFWRQMAADERRISAIERWLDLGGRLVVCCGRNAPKVIGEGGPLAKLVPGKFAEVVRLPQTRLAGEFRRVDGSYRQDRGESGDRRDETDRSCGTRRSSRARQRFAGRRAGAARLRRIGICGSRSRSAAARRLAGPQCVLARTVEALPVHRRAE